MICSSVNLLAFFVRLPPVDGIYPNLGEMQRFRSSPIAEPKATPQFATVIQNFTGLGSPCVSRVQRKLISMMEYFYTT